MGGCPQPRVDRILGEADDTVATAPFYLEMLWDPSFGSFTLSFCLVMLKSVRITLGLHLGSEASHAFFKATVMCKCAKGDPSTTLRMCRQKAI